MSAANDQADPIYDFLTEAYECAKEGSHLIQALPNVEVFAVERVVGKLKAVNSILASLKDPSFGESDIATLTAATASILDPLEAFLSSNQHAQRPAAATRPPNGLRGRPCAILDLQRAIELHNLSNSWEKVAEAMGVSRPTLYNHLARAGLSTTRPPFDAIDNSDLDELIAAISLKNPRTGANGIYGHLRGAGVNVPMERVKDSLRRIDPIGTLLRYVAITAQAFYQS